MARWEILRADYFLTDTVLLSSMVNVSEWSVINFLTFKWFPLKCAAVSLKLFLSLPMNASSFGISESCSLYLTGPSVLAIQQPPHLLCRQPCWQRPQTHKLKLFLFHDVASNHLSPSDQSTTPGPMQVSPVRIPHAQAATLWRPTQLLHKRLAVTARPNTIDPPLSGLKACNIIAWAEASPRVQAQVYPVRWTFRHVERLVWRGSTGNKTRR